MDSAKTRLGRVKAALAQPLKLHYQASSIALDLYLLRAVQGFANDAEVKELVARFRDLVHTAGLDDLLANQIRYAVRIAAADGQLLYEEIDKLMSLCDEIHALRGLGFFADEQSVEHFEAAVRARLRAQPKEARIVAEHQARDWNRSLWWYAESLRF
jgi:hypothetical protein